MISTKKAERKIAESVREGKSWYVGDYQGEPVYEKIDNHYPDRTVRYTVRTVEKIEDVPHHSIQTELERNPQDYPDGVYRCKPKSSRPSSRS